MNQTIKENKLDDKLNISRFPLNATKTYALGKDLSWVADMLKELNEKADAKSVEEYFENTNLDIEITITKKFKQPLGEYLLIKGHIEANFVTQCVRTLKDMPEFVELDIKAGFIDSVHQDSEMYSDQTEAFLDDDLYELYYHDKGFANIYEMLHEQIHLNINPYPIADSESLLEWGVDVSTTKQ